MSFRYSRLVSARGVPYAFAVAIIACVYGPARGGDPLALIPPDVAGVIAFPNLAGSTDKLTRFLKDFDLRSPGLDLRVLEDWLDLAPDTWDATKPVIFILTKPNLDIMTEPEFSDTTAVLAFTPKHPERYAAGAEGRESAVRRIEQNGRDYYVTMRDGVVFCCGKRRVMRSMRSVAPSESLAAALDDQQKALYAKSDFFVHLPLAGWSERIKMLAMLAGNMMKLGIATENDPTLMESSTLVLDWFTGGLRSTINQMQSLTLSIDFDGDTFRLAHYHAFHPDGSVCDYLRQVKRSGVDLWATLPDRPYYLLAGFDWHCPSAVSVAARFQDYVLNADTVAERISPELRREILDNMAACYDQTKGSYLMLTSPPGSTHPLQVLGGYYMEDADEGARLLRFVQENSTEAFAGFMGGNYAGKFERRTEDGREFYEMKFDPARMSAGVREQMSTMYGDNLRIQDAVVGRNYVLYAMSGDDGLLPDVVRAHDQGQNAGTNARLREIIGRLPADPHGIVVLDLGRALRAVPDLARMSLEMGETETKPAKSSNKAAAGARKDSSRADRSGDSANSVPNETARSSPLLGWACVIRPTSFSGHLAISAKDAIETARIAKEIAKDFPKGARRVRNVRSTPRPDN